MSIYTKFPLHPKDKNKQNSYECLAQKDKKARPVTRREVIKFKSNDHLALPRIYKVDPSCTWNPYCIFLYNCMPKNPVGHSTYQVLRVNKVAGINTRFKLHSKF